MRLRRTVRWRMMGWPTLLGGRPVLVGLCLWLVVQEGLAREPESPQAAGTIALQPAEVDIHSFYKGGTVQVTGVVAKRYEHVAVMCTGRRERVELKEKGKVWGILWMSVGETAFEGVPVLHLLRASGQLDQIASVEELRRLGLGYEGLRAAALGEQPSHEQAAVFGELIKLREAEKLYSVDERAVALGPDTGNDNRLVSTELSLPPKAPTGNYEVRLYGFAHGRGELLASATLTLKQVGFTSFISSMAKEHALLYGIMAVLIAVAAGLLMGLVFGFRSRKGR